MNNISIGTAIFGYYIIRDRVISYLFKDVRIKMPTLYYLFISIAVFLFNLFLKSFYVDASSTYIRGMNILPNFTLLFLFSDFISTLIMILLLRFRIKKENYNNILGNVVLDFIRILIIFVMFALTINYYVSKKISAYANYEYTCFSSQIEVDFAEYYLAKVQLPDNLSEFTTHTVNPVNNSPLLYRTGQTLTSVRVEDQAGNVIFKPSAHLSGITFKNNPSQFFRQYEIQNKGICNGTLDIPEF